MNILNRRSLMIFVLSNALTTQVLAVAPCPTDKANCNELYRKTEACDYFGSDKDPENVGTVIRNEAIAINSRYIQCQYPKRDLNFLIYGTGCVTNFSCQVYCDYTTFKHGLTCQ